MLTPFELSSGVMQLKLLLSSTATSPKQVAVEPSAHRTPLYSRSVSDIARASIWWKPISTPMRWCKCYSASVCIFIFLFFIFGPWSKSRVCQPRPRYHTWRTAHLKLVERRVKNNMKTAFQLWGETFILIFSLWTAELKWHLFTMFRYHFCTSTHEALKKTQKLLWLW